MLKIKSRKGLQCCETPGIKLKLHSHIHDLDRENWGYQLHGDDWVKLDAIKKVSGQYQSPINIDSSCVELEKAMADKPRLGIQFFYNRFPSCYEIHRTPGRAMAVQTGQGSVSMGYVIVDNKIFEVEEFHFHTPGEHTFNGSINRTRLEMHIVHAFRRYLDNHEMSYYSTQTQHDIMTSPISQSPSSPNRIQTYQPSPRFPSVSSSPQSSSFSPVSSWLGGSSPAVSRKFFQSGDDLGVDPQDQIVVVAITFVLPNEDGFVKKLERLGQWPQFTLYFDSDDDVSNDDDDDDITEYIDDSYHNCSNNNDCSSSCNIGPDNKIVKLGKMKEKRSPLTQGSHKRKLIGYEDILKDQLTNYEDVFRQSKSTSQETIDTETDIDDFKMDPLNDCYLDLYEFHYWNEFEKSNHKSNFLQKLLDVRGCLPKEGEVRIINVSVSPDAVEHEAFFDLFSLVSSHSEYYRYFGSLTTPPCKEVVEWFVACKPLVASAKQINIFQDLQISPTCTDGNYRNTQNTTSSHERPIVKVSGG